VAENDQPERIGPLVEVRQRRTSGRLDIKDPGQRAASNLAWSLMQRAASGMASSRSSGMTSPQSMQIP
jgi:hypothetical protein